MSGKSFFLRGKKNTKSAKFDRKQDTGKFGQKRKSFHNEEIDSDEEFEEIDVDGGDNRRGFSGSEDESGSDAETAQQKRLRLAESYLRERAQAIEKDYDDDEDGEDEEDRDAELTGELSRRLEDEILDRQGKLIQRVADSITLLRHESKAVASEDHQSIICNPQDNGLKCVTLRGHRRAVTCVALSATGDYVFSGSKDGSIAKWNAITGKRERLVCRRSAKQGNNKQNGNIDGNKKQLEAGHKHAVMAVAVSCDDKFVASGDIHGTILVWTFAEMRCLRALTGHRNGITALAFRKAPFGGASAPTSGSNGPHLKLEEAAHTLFSASADRTVKQWDVDQLAYVDTMLGHEDAITGLDALFAERCVTSGGRDGSIRVFKPALESQLVFHGDGAAIECVASLSDRFFVSGSDRNSVSLWNVMRKKPMYTVTKAHGGVAEQNSDNAQLDAEANSPSHDLWISAIAAVPNSDVFATGSRDGYIRIWQCTINSASDGDVSARRAALGGDLKRQQGEQLRGMRSAPLLLVPVRGVINSLSMRVAPANAKSATKADELVVAVGAGREHKAGRWWNLREAQNTVKVFRFTLDKRARATNS